MQPEDTLVVEHERHPDLADIVLRSISDNAAVVERVKLNRGTPFIGNPTLLELDVAIGPEHKRARRMLMDIREGRANMILMEASLG